MVSDSSRPIRVHQFHYSAAPGDAVTNQMKFIRRSLLEGGIVGDIFATEVKGGCDRGSDPVRTLAIGELAEADLVLIHHSHGNPRLNEILATSPPKALVYHNITPSRFFRHDPVVAELCDLGRRQLLQLRPKCIATFADSQFNAWELETLGFGKSRILPLFDIDSPLPLPRQALSEKTAHRLLFVGKIAPHKNQALLVKTAFYLKQMMSPAPQLVLVGGQDPIYGTYVRGLSDALGLQNTVEFAGKVSETELKHHYQIATAFLCVSRHEGFCVPVVEAMRSGLPIFARPTTGVRETLGSGGVQLLTRNPNRIAEIIAASLENPLIIEAALASQAAQLKQLSRVQTKAKVRSELTSLIPGARRSYRKAHKDDHRLTSGI